MVGDVSDCLLVVGGVSDCVIVVVGISDCDVLVFVRYSVDVVRFCITSGLSNISGSCVSDCAANTGSVSYFEPDTSVSETDCV